MVDSEIQTRRYNVAMRELACAAEALAREAGNIPTAEACAAIVMLADLSNQTGEQINMGTVGNVRMKLRALGHLVSYGNLEHYITIDRLCSIIVIELGNGAAAIDIARAIKADIKEEELQLFKHN